MDGDAGRRGTLAADGPATAPPGGAAGTALVGFASTERLKAPVAMTASLTRLSDGSAALALARTDPAGDGLGDLRPSTLAVGRGGVGLADVREVAFALRSPDGGIAGQVRVPARAVAAAVARLEAMDGPSTADGRGAPPARGEAGTGRDGEPAPPGAVGGPGARAPARPGRARAPETLAEAASGGRVTFWMTYAELLGRGSGPVADLVRACGDAVRQPTLGPDRRRDGGIASGAKGIEAARRSFPPGPSHGAMRRVHLSLEAAEAAVLRRGVAPALVAAALAADAARGARKAKEAEVRRSPGPIGVRRDVGLSP